MSEGNVELIRRQTEALNRGDLEAATEGIDPGIEWVVAREHPASRTVRGLDELRRYFEDWRETIGALRFDSERIVDQGDLVVSIGRIQGVGTGSGTETVVPIGFVSRFRDGLVIRVEEYLDPTEALKVAGLLE
jgi:ketosteroid isomerase-like protein